MKKILIQTPVLGSPEKIISKFDKKLFLSLKPPFVNIEVLRFDGCKKGDHIELTIDTPLQKNLVWNGFITEDGLSSEEAYFVDIGKKLPWPLKTWVHRHRIIKQSVTHSLIVDDIEFECLSWWQDILFYLPLWFQFYLRKPVYQKIFGRV